MFEDFEKFVLKKTIMQIYDEYHDKNGKYTAKYNPWAKNKVLDRLISTLKKQGIIGCSDFSLFNDRQILINPMMKDPNFWNKQKELNLSQMVKNSKNTGAAFWRQTVKSKKFREMMEKEKKELEQKLQNNDGHSETETEQDLEELRKGSNKNSMDLTENE